MIITGFYLVNRVWGRFSNMNEWHGRRVTSLNLIYGSLSKLCHLDYMAFLYFFREMRLKWILFFQKSLTCSGFTVGKNYTTIFGIGGVAESQDCRVYINELKYFFFMSDTKTFWITHFNKHIFEKNMKCNPQLCLQNPTQY